MNEKENEPTEEDLQSKEFNAVWNAIKRWDIGKYYPEETYENLTIEEGRMYSGATGSDVMIILNALRKIK